jgi:hypothetical protein
MDRSCRCLIAVRDQLFEGRQSSVVTNLPCLICAQAYPNESRFFSQDTYFTRTQESMVYKQQPFWSPLYLAWSTGLAPHKKRPCPRGRASQTPEFSSLNYSAIYFFCPYICSWYVVYSLFWSLIVLTFDCQVRPQPTATWETVNGFILTVSGSSVCFTVFAFWIRC